jgi:hypothetical protein
VESDGGLAYSFDGLEGLFSLFVLDGFAKDATKIANVFL